MFKVVKTVEDGITTFTEIPASWENSNKLLWPIISSRDKNADKKLMKLKYNNCPPDDSWEIIDCEVKGFYASYELARQASIMFATMDTEDEAR